MAPGLPIQFSIDEGLGMVCTTVHGPLLDADLVSYLSSVLRASP